MKRFVPQPSFYAPVAPTPPLGIADDPNEGKVPRRIQRLSEGQWLEALQQPSTGIELSRAGYVSVTRKWRMDRQSLDEHLVYLVTENSFEGRIDGDAVRVDPGAFFWIAPGLEHEFWIPSGRPPFTILFFRMRLKTPDRRADLALDRGCVFLSQAWSLRPLMEALVSEWRAERRYREARFRALLVLIFSTALRLEETQGVRASLDGREISRLLRYARTRARERPTPADLAGQLGLTHDYFTRVFRRTFGEAPRQWLLRDRIRLAAARLLESSLNISEVAREFGYADLFLFSRQFKQVLGSGPRAYRRRAGI